MFSQADCLKKEGIRSCPIETKGKKDLKIGIKDLLKINHSLKSNQV